MKLAIGLALVGLFATQDYVSAAACDSCVGCLWTYAGGTQCFTNAVKESCDAWGTGYTWCTSGGSTTTAPPTTAPTTKPATAAPTTKPATSAPSNGTHIQHQIRAGKVQSRGVNLGSWLVAESWMTSGLDAWNGVANPGNGEWNAIVTSTVAGAADRFGTIQKTFITESDIQAIAAQGLNTVRVPVGYWIAGFDNDDPSGKADWKKYPANGINQLDTLIKTWALKYNVAVLICIHAAKGSQNGQDNSSPTDIGKSYWSDYPENISNTLHLVQWLTNRYKNDDAFLGFSLLNEPTATTDETKLYQYYKDAYALVRGTGSDCILAIMPLLYKQYPSAISGLMEAPAYTNVWVEWHPYFIWSFESKTQDQLLDYIRTTFQGYINTWYSRPTANKLFFGEWSFASFGGGTVNGVNYPAQFPPSSSRFLEWAQTVAKVEKQATGGWTYWSWKIQGDTSGFNSWSMKNVLSRADLKQLVMS